MIFEVEDGEDEAAGDQEVVETIVPDYDNEFVRAKTFLQKCSTFSGDNL